MAQGAARSDCQAQHIATYCPDRLDRQFRRPCRRRRRCERAAGDVGPGYRVYYTTKEAQVVLLLCGGDKDSQERDIRKAKEMAAQLE
jgi:hypothetical protein